MPNFVNKHGQPPHPPLPADHPLSVTKPPFRAKHRLLQRMGHEAIDTTRCQAPVASRIGYSRCTLPATHVIVENALRDGRIAAMSVCDVHHKALLVSQPADYAEIHPLTP